MPDPFVMEVAVQSKSAKGALRLKAAIEALCAESDDIGWCIDQESGQTILRGRDELELDGLIGRLLDKVPVIVGPPQVSYRETITEPARLSAIHARTSGPTGEFAKVLIDFEPLNSGEGFQFASSAGPAVPDEYIPGVREGIERAAEHGLIAGFPVVDFKATLVDGAFHNIDSSPRAFSIAARTAFKGLREHGRPVLLEPVMKVVATAPEALRAAMGRFMEARRGSVCERLPGGLVAHVPLSNLFGVRSACRGEFADTVDLAVSFSHYAPVPQREEPDPDFTPAIGMRA